MSGRELMEPKHTGKITLDQAKDAIKKSGYKIFRGRPEIKGLRNDCCNQQTSGRNHNG